MARLNPPYIENIISPFIINEKNEISINIPFVINRAVSQAEIKEVSLILKTISTNQIIYTTGGNCEFIENTNNGIATFNITDNEEKVNSGQFYKVQIAFIDNNNQIGYYSSVSTIRCIKEPTISFEGFETKKANEIKKPLYKYTAICNLNEPTEKIYSYSFKLVDEDKNVLFNTGEKIHNSIKDTESNRSVDSCFITQTLNLNKKYNLIYSIKTINGYEKSSSIELSSVESVEATLKNNILVAEPDLNNGVISVKLAALPGKKVTPLTYNFILLRASSKDNFETWTRISKIDEDNEFQYIELENDLIEQEMLLWEDFTVESGYSYKYALQAYNGKIFSNKIESRPSINDLTPAATYIEFEDMFLSDGNRQLRIQFDPKVSSFKSTVLESKVDTIGSKYPFFFKNGTVNYKEFPISGLISFLMDPDNKFKSSFYDNPSNSYTYDTNLTLENKKREKDFKLEVLDWLNNGEVKLFKSASEGCYLVRLMNVSLSPNDTLGRMLHTFSCTAYEVDEYNFENLEKYGFIQFELLEHKLAAKVKQIKFKASDYLNNDIINLSIPGAVQAQISDVYPLDLEFRLGFNNNDIINVYAANNGIYNIPLTGDLKLMSIELDKNYLQELYDNYGIDASFKITYTYYDTVNLTNFHFIDDIVYTKRFIQEIGKINYNLNTDLENRYFKIDNNNLIEVNEADKQFTLYMPPKPTSIIGAYGIREIGNIYHISLKKRPVFKLYKDNSNNCYLNESMVGNPIDSEDFDERLLIQALYQVDGENGLRDYSQPQEKQPYTLIKNNSSLYEYKIIDQNNIETVALINAGSNPGDLGTNFELNTTDLINTPIKTLQTGQGIITEIYYMSKDISYDFNSTNWAKEALKQLTSSTITTNKEGYSILLDKIFSQNYINELQNNLLKATQQNAIQSKNQYIKENLQYKQDWINNADLLSIAIYMISDLVDVTLDSK